MTRKLQIINLVAVLFALGQILIPQLVLGPQFTRSYTLDQRIANGILFFPTYILSLALFFSSGGARIAKSSLLLPIFLMVAWGVISIAWAVDVPSTLVSLFSTMTTVCAGIGIAGAVSYKIFVRITTRVIFLAAIISVVEVYFIPSWGVMHGFGGAETSNLYGLPQGAFRHKNQFAEVMSIGFLVAMCGKEYLSSSMRMAVMLLAGYCVIIASSATALVAVIISSLAILLYGKMSSLFKRSAMLMSFSIGVVLASVAAVFFDQTSILGYLGKDTTLTGRSEIWSHAYTLIELRPLNGYGYGSIWNTSLGGIPGSYLKVPHSHNMWFEAGVMGGIPMTILLLAFFISILLATLIHAPRYREMGMFGLGMTIFSIVRTGFEVDITGNNITFFVLVVSISYLIKEKSAERDADPARTDRYTIDRRAACP